MKKKFVKKRERAAMEEDLNQNVVETNTKKAFVKPQDWTDDETQKHVFM